MLLHSGFVVLGGVANVAFACVLACVFLYDQSVAAHVVIVALACFVAMAVAIFVHDLF